MPNASRNMIEYHGSQVGVLFVDICGLSYPALFVLAVCNGLSPTPNYRRTSKHWQGDTFQFNMFDPKFKTPKTKTLKILDKILNRECHFAFCVL